MNLTSPSEISAFLRENNLSALKQFGQNFLCDANIIRKIAEATGVDNSHGILEIGMGLGALTMALAQRAEKVVAVEIDRGLIQTRSADVESSGNVRIIEGDILRLGLKSVWRQEFDSRPIYVCGNLPYYITGRILIQVLSCGLPVIRFTAMVQKEVAQRLCAAPGDPEYGAATAYADYFSHPRILFQVSRSCFYPAPEVDSAIISIDLEKQVPDVPFAAYHAIVRMAFAMRRKTLYNNMRSALGPMVAKTALETSGIDPGLRAQQIGSEQFAELTRAALAAGWVPPGDVEPDEL